MSFPAEEEQYVGVWEVIGKILFTCVCRFICSSITNQINLYL